MAGNVSGMSALMLAAALVAVSAAVRPATVRAESSLPLTTVATIRLPGAATRFDDENLDRKRIGSSWRISPRAKSSSLMSSRIVSSARFRLSSMCTVSSPYLNSVASARPRPVATSRGHRRAHARIHRPHTRRNISGLYGVRSRRSQALRFGWHGGTDTVIDTMSNARVATIPLGGEIGNTQYDARSHRIYVNVQTTGELVAIDPSKNTVVARYPLPGCKSNHGCNSTTNIAKPTSLAKTTPHLWCLH
jgi:hypothetical protein